MFSKIIYIILLFPVTVYSQVATQDPATAMSLINAQQNYLLQQQQAQMMALEQAQVDQAAQAAKNAKIQGIGSLISGVCSKMFTGSSLTTTAGTSAEQDAGDLAYQMGNAAYTAREQQGWVYEKDLDENTAREIGADASAKFQVGCNQFINKQGQVGPWGSYALQQIKDKPNSFGGNVPDDITKWCPKYPNMNKTQRELYWVWILMSMASSESSCNPRADNPNAPNGVARGLFQVWKPVCPKSRNLHNPNENIQCAIDLLADELENRDTLMTPTSKGNKGTYWGPLRSDDWNKRRGGDIAGAQKTRGLMAQYRYCK